MMQRVIEIAFTAFVVILIVLPVPPSSIIGVALATNPKTGKYMNKRVYAGVEYIMSRLSIIIAAIIIRPARIMTVSRKVSTRNQIRTGQIYR